MTHLKKFFETPMKAVISSVCALGILAGVGTGTAYAASAIAENTSIGAENAPELRLCRRRRGPGGGDPHPHRI